MPAFGASDGGSNPPGTTTFTWFFNRSTYVLHMKAELMLRVEYGNRDSAELIQKSLHPDNDGYLESEVEGDCLVFHMESDSTGTLRNTVNDLLACLKLAEETLSLGSSHAVPDLDGDAFLE